jgi:hypothetical protein
LTIFWVVIILVNVGEYFYGAVLSDFSR